jgi:OHCU decarboxylase
MHLSDLNALDEAAAVAELRRCCGSWRWAREMAVLRPFASIDALYDAADRQWRLLGRADILEAFAAHPRIGRAEADGDDGGPQKTRWSTEEQAGVRHATDAVAQRLAEGNRAYEARFGYIFIICATGKSAAQMLAALEARLGHAPEEELRIAAEEQRRITRLRLARLVDAEQTTP